MFTTASTKPSPDFRSNRLLQILAAIYAAVWVVTAISPVDRFDWFLENLLVFIVTGILAATYRRFPFSDLSYLLISGFLCLHAVGAHYTYSEVPAGFWMKEAFDFERNHYDRIVHFLFGLLLSYPLSEVILRKVGISGVFRFCFAFALALSLSSSFEIIEWIVAEIVDPAAAYAYLGTQGDLFDAQKDTVLAGIGAAIGLVMTAILESRLTEAAKN